jgi:hypothetical protein
VQRLAVTAIAMNQRPNAKSRIGNIQVLSPAELKD